MAMTVGVRRRTLSSAKSCAYADSPALARGGCLSEQTIGAGRFAPRAHKRRGNQAIWHSATLGTAVAICLVRSRLALGGARGQIRRKAETQNYRSNGAEPTTAGLPGWS